MDAGVVSIIVEELVNHPSCFTSRDILAWYAGEQLRYSDIFNRLDDDRNFIKINDGVSNIYISKKTLRQWLVRLNDRLARAKKTKLEIHKFRTHLNELQPDNRRWNVVPSEYIEFGQELGLVHFLFKQEELIFPIAYVISFLSPSNINASYQYLIDLSDQDLSIEFDQVILQAVKNVLESLTTREESVIAKREGMLGNPKMTLEEIGKTFNVSRERIRQIEEKGFRKLHHPSRCNKLVLPLVYYLQQSHGTLLINREEIENEILFTAKILNIPVSQFPYTDKFVLGLNISELTVEKESIGIDVNIYTIDKILKQQSKIPFTQEDLETITILYREKPVRHITKSERVYQVLKQIGKPSHYSEITEVYNDMYPEDASNDHSIHAILTREEHGVVWIGIKGTYALKEWGFERPSETLFETVRKIVRRKYEETKKPVSFLIVQAEIGKYRKLINRNSLLIASYLNPDIKTVNKYQLIPSYAMSEEKRSEDISSEELNKILENFELKTKGEGRKMIEPMSFEKALQIAKEALEAYKQAKTKADMDEIFIKYGRNGIGYRPLCKMFYAQKPPEVAVKVYKKE